MVPKSAVPGRARACSWFAGMPLVIAEAGAEEVELNSIGQSATESTGMPMQDS